MEGATSEHVVAPSTARRGDRRSRPAGRTAERGVLDSDEREDRVRRRADRRWPTGYRSDELRQSEGGAAARRCRRSHDRDSARRRHALPGSRPEPKRASSARWKQGLTRSPCSRRRPRHSPKRTSARRSTARSSASSRLSRTPGSVGFWVRGYVSVAFGCPYSGAVDARAVISRCRATARAWLRRDLPRRHDRDGDARFCTRDLAGGAIVSPDRSAGVAFP